MRRHLIQSFCDFCWNEDNRETEATHSDVIGIRPGETVAPADFRVVLACEHHHELLDRLTSVVDAGERLTSNDDLAIVKRRPPQNAAPRVTCEICYREYSRSYVIKHVWDHHVTGTPPSQDTCPDCDKSFADGSNPQVATVQHRRISHGYDPLAEAYKHARAELAGGDTSTKPPQRHRTRKATAV